MERSFCFVAIGITTIGTFDAVSEGRSTPSVCAVTDTASDGRKGDFGDQAIKLREMMMILDLHRQGLARSCSGHACCRSTKIATTQSEEEPN
ncbi:hypothetical protein GOC38_28820 [Sinorhizobium meliloti]|nr:hypothetical protein [Sinorhizobium meliloti]MDX0321580.1 hypothetical protein [Sinorhizobium meliloti]MDX0328014.1 hypothetical protein [Sinorhizobium meliloti]